MPPLPINNNNNVPIAEMQQEPAVHNNQPNANLPPELQNARPANRSILGRIASFFFGAGAGGGAAFSLGAGTLLEGVIGGSAVLAAGVATGGAALIGGAVALGIYMGIKALVHHFRHAPDPEPRLQNMPQNNLPQDQPAADAFKNSVANAITNGTMLPSSLQNTADNLISKMREVYGETLVPQGAQLHYLVDSTTTLVHKIKNIEGDLTPEKLGEILEKEIRDHMAISTLDNAFKPLCGDKVFLARQMRKNANKKDPELLPALKTATTQAQVQEILRGHSQEFRELVELNRRATSLVEGSKAKSIATIAQSVGLDADVVASVVKPLDFDDEARKLVDAITQGKVKVNANAIEQEFAKLADKLAKPYLDAFKIVEEDTTLSATAKNSLKRELLTAPNVPNPLLYSNGIAAGKKVDAAVLKLALDKNMPAEAINEIFFGLGEKVNQALKEQYGPEAWDALANGKPDDLKNTQAAAVLAMLDKQPGLLDALRAREDLHVYDEMCKMLLSNTSPSLKSGAQTAYIGHVRLLEVQESTDDIMKMEKQTQLLNTIKSAEIPQELKTSWTEKVLSGMISEPAMVQSLIANVPNLAPETRPIMEQYILKQSYTPDQAQESAKKAQYYAAEMSGWQNFDTTNDLSMAPVANWIKDDISSSLYAGQDYDNHSISNQMKLDVPRSVWIINGEVMKKPDAEQVSQALRRALPTKNATKFVSSIINQRSFAPLGYLGMQMHPTGGPMPENVLACLTKMASRNVNQAEQDGMFPFLHFDLAAKRQGEINYTVTVQNGKAQIDASSIVGLDFGLGTDENGSAQLVGKVRYTLHFECDLLGNDNQSPSIQNVHLKQEFLSK